MVTRVHRLGELASAWRLASSPPLGSIKRFDTTYEYHTRWRRGSPPPPHKQTNNHTSGTGRCRGITPRWGASATCWSKTRSLRAGRVLSTDRGGNLCTDWSSCVRVVGRGSSTGYGSGWRGGAAFSLSVPRLAVLFALATQIDGSGWRQRRTAEQRRRQRAAGTGTAAAGSGRFE